MFKRIFFILSLLGTIVPSCANNLALEDNLPLLAYNQSGNDKSSSIIASINGHYLTVAFTESLGEVSIEVQNGDGVPVDLSIMDTPTGFMTYIPLAGRYTLIIKLEDGDEYFGEFEVED